MNITGTRAFNASREQIWSALHDAELLRSSIKGCSELQWVSDNELEGALAMKLGPVKAKFSMQLTVTDSVENRGYTLVGKAKASALGFAGGQAQVELKDVESGCLLEYEAQINTGGKLAAMGARLLNSASEKYVEDFFESMAQAVDA